MNTAQAAPHPGPATPPLRATSTPARPGRLRLLAGIPIPILLLAMLALWSAHLHASYGSASLIMALNLIFSLLTSLLIVFLVSRSFLTRGTPGLLMLGCGVLTWGAAGVLAKVVIQGDANADVTIHNLCVWVSALFHFTSALLLLRPRRALQARALWLGVAYAVAVGLLMLVALAALHGWTPVFFVQGAGGTTVRQLVLGSAIVMFLLTAGLLKGANRRPLPTFLYWYALALGLIAVGLFGIMIESVFASLLSWAGLAAQYLSGVYMLVAAIATVRESGAWHISLESALRESQDALRQSEERLRLLVDGTQDCAIFMLDPQGRITTWNEGGRRLKGYEAEEVIGRHFSLCYTPEDIAADKPAMDLETALREGKYEEEGERVRKDGSRFWASVLISPLRDEQDKLRGFSKLVRDISDRKQAEEQMRDLTQRLTYHVDNSPLAVIEWGPDMRLVRWSAGAERLFGWKPEEVLGKRMEDFRWIYQEDEPQVAEVSADLQAGANPGRFSANRNYCKDGSVVHCEWYNSSLVDASGKFLSILSLVLDVTERKRAEERQRESEERYRSLFEHMLDGFAFCRVLYENGSPCDFTYLSVNAAFERLTGLQNVTGKKVSEVIPGVHQANPELLERYGRVALTGQPERFETYLESLGIWFSIAVYSPLKDHFVAVFDNITERKRAEDALKFLAQCGSAASGEDFFQALARYLGQSLSMDYVCIDRLEEGSLTARTVAIYFDGKFEDNVSYTLKDTPCGDVVGKTICCFPKDVRRLFPKDAVLQQMSAESYVGVTLWGSQGQPIGLIALLSRKPLADSRLATSILQIVAVRAAAELEHRLAEAEVRRHAGKLAAANDELTRFNNAMVGRELRMIELKKEINDLCVRFGQPPRYESQINNPPNEP